MKIKVEYSESIEVMPGLWRKIGIDMEMDTETDSLDGSGRIYSPNQSSQLLHNQAKEYVQRWHKEDRYSVDESKGVEFKTTHEGIFPIQSTVNQPPVIDRAIERLEILIDDCKTREGLAQIYSAHSDKILSNDSLSKLYNIKAGEINGG